jgi:streptogramin lyase
MGLDDAGNLYLTGLSGRIVRLRPDKTYAPLTAMLQYSTFQGLTASHDGTVYYTFGNSLRKLTPAGVVTTIAGDVTERGSADGMGAQARFDFFGVMHWGVGLDAGTTGGAIVIDSAGNLYVTDAANQTVRKVTALGVVTTIAGNPGVSGIRLGSLPGGLFSPIGLALLDDKTLFVSSGNAVLKISLP